MSLYQEVRPTKLEEIVGNTATVGALRRMLREKSSNQPHAILLKGPTGCGKTTIARILAKEFGSTKESIFEYNAANTKGIEVVRDIATKVFLLGLGGATKTYIIDESHELTSPAQECFLKVLEDTPKHCYFIFCTTDPDRLIATVRNRCVEYAVSTLIGKELKEVLERACDKKKLDIHEDVIDAIVMRCDGSPRAALGLLEKVFTTSNVDEALELIEKGTLRDPDVIALLKLLVNGPDQRSKKWKYIIEVFSAIDEDSEKVRKSILTFLFNKLKKQESEEDAKDITHLLSIFSTSTYYGGKAQLGALVARACFETWRNK